MCKSLAQQLLSTYTDGEFAKAKIHRSTSGIVCTIHAAPISKTSSIQDTVALSTCKAEYLVDLFVLSFSQKAFI